ncbi:TPA: BPSL0067 family protein [Escherichia coli]|uniref:BPSL0067 family protein n=1 Tax=Escherichia coli TaxID=562 RepID=UPI000B80072F|nr:BPSL0067 family protein [Escherichia coli]EFC5425040.1 BPSL0067 family protein [Escherichia coli]MCJ1099484.1 BPSL0067 family protein [Escherichia coli]MCJ1202240.1 BPSL0067 family protein [Escherichia coli]MCW9755060.1 BPSL0067 family protein [Escherichia coli]HBB4014687.1 BPSL0067 family protein [Escherichia coli]
MAYVYGLVDSLQGTDMVGMAGAGDRKECVFLVQVYAHVGNIGTWKQGRKVFGDKSIPRGTAIATFVNGKYPSRQNDHKHAAFYLEQDSQYIYVMDQWTGKTTKVSTRPIARKGGMRSDGTYPDASNNAEAFYIIE